MMKPLILVLLLLANAQQLAAAPRVLVSVGPLQLIADQIMAGAGRSELLIEPDVSPHHFQLRPSHLRKLANSDLLVWISNDFEIALARLTAVDKNRPLQLQLAGAIPETLLIGRGHDRDGHLWLDPTIVQHIAQRVTERLIELDPDRRALYENNARQLSAAVSRWRDQARDQLEHQPPRYITNHRFLAYLERSLGLASSSALRNSHDHGGHVRSLSRLHDRLQQQPVRCLLIDREPASRLARQVAERHGLDIQAVNILGGSDSHGSIIELYDRILTSLKACR